MISRQSELEEIKKSLKEIPKIRPYEQKNEKKLSPLLDPGEKAYALNLG